MVRSQFENLSVVWSPSAKTSINKLEAIQKRAVRWILDEQYQEYDNELVYLQKLETLNILPIKFRLIFTDLCLFQKIMNKTISIELPLYFQPTTEEELTKLRTTHKDPDYLECNIEEKLDIFENSYFNRTRNEWNRLPLNLRKTKCLSTFQSRLKEHLWEIVSHDPEISDSSFSSDNSDIMDTG